MTDGVTVNVRVPGSDEDPEPPTPSHPATPQPPASEGSLPTTGIDVVAGLVLFLVLIALGVALLRSADPSHQPGDPL
ncbi:MAG: hypothetical protein R3320_13335 [Nitriliruptorales bacterium]|nr:hypothetical protein [Nitriliruptorales bacterium]